MDKAMPLVEFSEVTFSYGSQRVLDRATFAIMPGEFLGIIGPNGSGKTTILRLITGALQPASGRVHLFGKPLQTAALLRIGYVPQSKQFDLKFPITVGEVVLGGLLSRLAWWGGFRRAERQAAVEALLRVGLDLSLNHPFSALSGGQLQRVLIARALVGKPELLLLDEPTAHVDSAAESDFFVLMRTLRKEMTILMVTHDLQASLSCFTSVLCVRGTIERIAPEALCHHFALGLYHEATLLRPVKEPPHG